jgi:polysaccharide biosynthesis transport protein
MQILGGIWRRRKLVVCASMLLVFIDIGIAVSLPKTYRAEALLQVDERTVKTVVSDGGIRSVAADLDAGGLSSQADIIRAPNLALQVIRSQRLLDTPDFSAALAQGGTWRIVTDTVAKIASAAGYEAEYTAFLAAHRENPRAAERHRTEDAIKYFEKHLDVTYDQHGASLRIAYRSSDPELSAAVVNAVARAYVEEQLRSKLDLLLSAGTWLDQRLAALRSKAEQAEGRLVQFRREHHLDTEQAPGLVKEQLRGLTPQLAQAVSQEANATARLEAARNSNGQDVPEVLASKVIEDLRKEETAANIRLLSAKLSGNRIAMERAEAGIKELAGRLRAERDRILGGLRIDLEAAKMHRRNVQDALARLVAQARQTDQAYSEAAIIEREAIANRAVFNAVVQKTEETRTLNGLQRPDVQVVSAALAPGSAYSPKIGLIAILGGFVSLFVACAAAALIEIANPRIRSLGQGEVELGIPALGWMPSDPQSGRGKLVGDEMPEGGNGLTQDCCRSIMMSATALAPREGQVLLITSAAPNEGKTTFALSYARTIAAAGRSCVVVNADLRRPFGAAAGRVQGEPGLADVLADRGTLETVVHIDPSSKLAILDAGSSDGDPIGVFASRKFPKLIAELRRRYDTVIVDAPPLLAVSEGLLLARHADFTVVVVRWGVTPTRTVATALERLKVAGAGAVAFVLAQVDVRQMQRTEIGRYAVEYARRG